MRLRVLAVLATCAVAVPAGLLLAHRLRAAPTVRLPLQHLAQVSLPGTASRFDYADLDAPGHRLFLAHMASGELLEVDTRTRQALRVVPDLPSVTGVLVVPELHRVFASAAGAGQVVTFDEDTGAVLARTAAGEFPDGLAYVASTGQVWVSDESGGVETVLDATSGASVGMVRLGGEAGNVRYDPTGDRVLVDVQSRNELLVIDPHSRTVTARVRVPGCDHDHGLILDATRAYVACDGNAALVVLALQNLSRLATLRVGADPDVLALDLTRRLLYVAAESGVVTLIDTTATDRAPGGRVLGRDRLADNAHVVAVDPTTGIAYFPLRSGLHGHPVLLLTTPQLGRSPTDRSTP